jgi:lantibiotic leader peptide-processing serine protease
MPARLRVLLLGVLCLMLFAGTGGATTNATGGSGEKYIVLYKSQSVPSDAAATIAKAGGSLVYSYGQIGVAIAESASASFRDNLLRDNRVENASVTGKFATRLPDTQAGTDTGDLPNAPATDADSFSGLQWDMRQIKAPEAHAVTGGSPAVLVGDIDTGLDKDHPDLQPNIDAANSVNCVTGIPVPGAAAADDDNGHGTHTAGTIAAAANGIGIVGVAPNVKIAGIKAGNAAGYFFPEAVVCAFVWAATHHFDVTNNSYFADPFLFNCRNDPVQHAIWKAEQRAIRFAQQNGVTVVASEGNDSEDLAHPTADATSPDFPPGTNVTRPVTNACVVIPVEVSGVIGVTATGNARQTDNDSDPNDFLKSFYSNFGVGTTEVTAPGGDSIFGRTPEAVNGRVLSTYPADQFCRPDRRLVDPVEPTAVYCYLQGTSMAGPHAVGVAALIVSRFGNLSNPQNGKMSPGAVQSHLDQTADPQPCPTALPPGYLDFVGFNSGVPQKCQGGPGSTSWYGKGQVNAFNAVTK